MSGAVSRQERSARGKAARSVARRSGNADWSRPPDHPGAVAVLKSQDASRVAELVPIRYGRMSESPFAMFRGGAAVMAADLAAAPVSGLTAQLCGDAHLSNFGGFASPDRSLVFDLNDFDETHPGPWEWDLKRLVASIEIAARQRGLGADQARAAVLATAREYRRAVRRFAKMTNLEVWYSRLDAEAFRQRWLSRAKGEAKARAQRRSARATSKDSTRALAKLTTRVNGEPRIVGDPPLIVPIEDFAPKAMLVDADERIRALLDKYAKTLSGGTRTLLDGYRYAHLARKVVGVGSVGTRALIVLLLGGDDSDPLFLQVKEAQRSVLEPYSKRSRYRSHGQRVIEGQWLMQASSDIFLGWLSAEGIDGIKRDFYVRQLWDWKLSAEIERMSPAMLAAYGEMCGWTLARAHARSADRVALAGYLGSGDVLDRALVRFAKLYGDQNERDYESLTKAVKAGEVQAEAGG